MKFLHATLLLSALVAQPVLAEFSFTDSATLNGVPIPKSEIKLEPFEPIPRRINHNASAPAASSAHRKVRRANTAAYSSNWCGSVSHTTSTNQIKLIHAYFQHPSCTKRTGVTMYPQAAAAWAGIDGDSWTSALLQSGTVCKIDNSTGVVRNEAWWQWVPSGAFTISSMPVAANDWFEVLINTTSTTAAKITLTNISQGYAYTVTVTGGATLARVDADWILERPYYGSSLAGFAQFTDVWFQEAYATLSNGASLGILGAKQYQISGTCASAEYDNADLAAWVP
ncbi:concanavalin A-like lectin/glucanase domain-containing protein [Bombardia bombarda]|uniref:Concanavalin A-like lectin/glucanase domain-containing protein n=1 Tax=Bombardia bombarda TaxID=252184 RepID=A0AA39WHN1_9PEZI|nr:concanavalin A-like lectin/glucanase domain-containing protein [Bombardia bombarda]